MSLKGLEVIWKKFPGQSCTCTGMRNETHVEVSFSAASSGLIPIAELTAIVPTGQMPLRAWLNLHLSKVVRADQSEEAHESADEDDDEDETPKEDNWRWA